MNIAEIDTIPIIMEPKCKINKLPEKYENMILSLLSFNDKLILAGSLGLYILDVFNPFDRPEKNNHHVIDFDFGLTNKLTVDELNYIKDFFNLNIINTNMDYGTTTDLTALANDELINAVLDNELIQFHKYEYDNEKGYVDYVYKIDFFNKEYLKNKDIIEVDYFGTTIRITHPSITLSYKAKYAYDIRVGKQTKHFIDLHEQIDWNKYFNVLKHVDIKDTYDPTTDDCKYIFNPQPSHLEIPF
jgi:hypothetical protein